MKNILEPDRIIANLDRGDGRLVAVNKPARIAAHGPCATSNIGLDKAVSHVIGDTVYAAHRLDRDTTGVMLLGNRTPLRQVQHVFFEREAQKTYWALVHGKFPTECVVEMTCRLDPDANPVVVGRGKESTTYFRALENFGERWTLVEAKPHTGRKHQIRASIAYLGYPIVGDKLYYPHRMRDKLARADEELKPSRFYLHAKELEIRGPFNMEFEAPVERDFQETLEALAS